MLSIPPARCHNSTWPKSTLLDYNFMYVMCIYKRLLLILCTNIYICCILLHINFNVFHSFVGIYKCLLIVSSIFLSLVEKDLKKSSVTREPITLAEILTVRLSEIFCHRRQPTVAKFQFSVRMSYGKQNNKAGLQ